MTCEKDTAAIIKDAAISTALRALNIITSIDYPDAGDDVTSMRADLMYLHGIADAAKIALDVLVEQLRMDREVPE